MHLANQNVSPTMARTTRHQKFYLRGGDIIFLVEGILFRVHRYFLERDSAYFREELRTSPCGDSLEGHSDSNPFVLENVKSSDFALLLWVIYNPKYSMYDASLEDWLRILELADHWTFTEVKKLVVRQLEKKYIKPVQKIVLYTKYDIDRSKLLPSYVALSARFEPITDEEGEELGMEMTINVFRARDCYSRISSLADHTHSSDTVEEMIRDVFELESPSSSVDSGSE